MRLFVAMKGTTVGLFLPYLKLSEREGESRTVGDLLSCMLRILSFSILQSWGGAAVVCGAGV